jgi:hypothetical protein
MTWAPTSRVTATSGPLRRRAEDRGRRFSGLTHLCQPWFDNYAEVHGYTHWTDPDAHRGVMPLTETVHAGATTWPPFCSSPGASGVAGGDGEVCAGEDERASGELGKGGVLAEDEGSQQDRTCWRQQQQCRPGVAG